MIPDSSIFESIDRSDRSDRKSNVTECDVEVRTDRLSRVSRIESHFVGIIISRRRHSATAVARGHVIVERCGRQQTAKTGNRRGIDPHNNTAN
jgi:hypothetical protein